MHVGVYLSTHLCLCWLICRRGRSGVRTTMSCSWQMSMPTRGNSTRQQSFTNVLATNPKPWACTLTCECLSTQRWLIVNQQKHTYAWTAYLCIYIDRTNWKGLRVLGLWNICFSSSYAVMPSWGPVLCSTGPPLPSAFHLLIYHWNLHIYHPIRTHIFLYNARVTYTHRCSCKWRTNGKK